MKKTIALCLASILCILSLAGCAAEKKEPVSDKTASVADQPVSTAGQHVELLRIGTTNTNESFNATSQSGILGRINYTGFCQGNMFVMDEKGLVQPGFLESYTISEDNRVLTLKIPTNGTWHDGKPVTIEDLKFTFEYNRDVILSSTYKNIDSLEVVGDDTLVITFNEKQSAFSYVNSASTMAKIYPKHIWEKVDKPDEYMGEDRNIGCGPYKLISIDQDAQISYYDAVPNYCKGELTVDKVFLKTYASPEALVMGMANDEIDAMYDYSKPIPTTLYDTVEKSENVDLGKAQDLGNKMLMMGFRAKPTDDLAFRQALSYALDYEMLALTVGGKYATVGSRGVIPSNNKGYNDTLESMATDLEKAAQLFDEAGYKDTNGDGIRELKDGSALNLIITPQYNKSQQETMARIGAILVDNLNKVGIKATFDEASLTSKEEWSKRAEQDGSYNIHIGYCTSGMASYIGVPTYLVDSSITKWWGTWKDPKFLEPYDALKASANFEEYDTRMKALQKVMADEVGAIPVCWETAAFPYRTDQYEGWINFPGEGVINAKTWYNLRTK